MFFFKKKQGTEGQPAASPASVFWQRFRRNRLAKWSLRLLYGLVALALVGDFIANDKPLYCRLEGKMYFPVLRHYAVQLGLVQQEARFYQKSWNEHDYESVIFPPIPYSATTADLKNSNYRSPLGPQSIASNRYRHWLGTDGLGHDVAAGMIAGTRMALVVGVVSMFIATLVGLLLGSLAGYFGDAGFRMGRLRCWTNLAALPLVWFYGFQTRGFVLSEAAAAGHLLPELLKSLGIALLILAAVNAVVSALQRLSFFEKKMTVPLDLLVMRSAEVLNSIPGVLLLLAVVGMLEKSSLLYVMALIGLLRWTGVARYLRAELLKIKTLGYIEAARAMGFSHWRILVRHALPNALGPVLITVAFGVASAVLLESSLSFLGIGAGDDEMTWGRLLAQARGHTSAWWLAVFPGLGIFLTVTVFNLIGEGLSEAMSDR